MMDTTVLISCLDCGHKEIFNPLSIKCPICGSYWREALYDYAHIKNFFRVNISKRPFNLWRYIELLPVRNVIPSLFMGEGGTPLLRAVNLGMMLGHPNIYIKDERQGPTSSFKDRQAAVSVAALKVAGIPEFICASTGNVAISYSAYAARAGIKLWAFLTSLVPAAKMREVAIYGTQVIKVTGSYDQAKVIAEKFSKERGIFLDLGSRSIPCIESMKTIAFEICEQLTDIDFQNSVSQVEENEPPWKNPSWYVQSVSGGLGPLGVIKGFSELKTMGIIPDIPKFALIQADGCAPMVHAWKQNREMALPVLSPKTVISTLATGDPGRTYSELRKRMVSTNGGVFESVSDEDAFRTMHLLAKLEGISVEPAAAVGFAGLIKLIRNGTIRPDEVVVINCTGHTMPIERSILGDTGEKNIDVQTSEMQENKEEGLLAALYNVSMDKFPRIAIVDDEPAVRQLIRRILHSQGNYTLFEAADGRSAIDMINKEKPNLIILDLMMPEVDGFSVMETLHSNRQTSNIPIIVITAKELTGAEKQRLKGHVQSLMQKGNFMSDELLDEVKALLK